MFKRYRLLSFLTIILIALLACQSLALACTDILVGKAASTDGSVITSHTCDGRYDSRLQIVPAQDFEPGSMAPVYENIVYGDRMELVKLGEIPQVEHTYKYFHVAYPFANEHQVIIGETTIGGAPETKNSDEAIMTIEQLEVFALQRGKTAKEVIQIMGDLAVEYGFRESCYLGECLTVSDPDGVWVFEVFGVGPLWTQDSGKPGAVWAAQRVPDNHVTIVPNHSRIGEIDPDDTENFMVCDNYVDTAVELGLYDPDSGEPFIWKYIYGDILEFTGWGQIDRLWRFYNWVAPSQEWEFDETDTYPFSIQPEEELSVYDVIGMYRDTMKDTKYDMADSEAWYYLEDGKKVKSPLATPQVDGNWRNLLGIEYYRPIARYYCSYFFVSQARDWLPDEIGGLIWFGLDNPENSPFIPVYLGIEDVPESWKTLDRDKLDRNSAWWAFGLVDDCVNRLYGDLKPELDEVLNPLQESYYTLQDQIEKTAVELYQEDPAKARAYLTNYTSQLMNGAEATYWKLVDKFLFELNNN